MGVRARAALAGGGPRNPSTLIDEILRSLIEQTQATAAFVVDACGQLLGAADAGANADGIDVSAANAIGSADTSLLKGEVVWLANREVVARMCGAVALLFVVSPRVSAILIAARIATAAARVATVVIEANPESRCLTADDLTGLLGP